MNAPIVPMTIQIHGGWDWFDIELDHLTASFTSNVKKIDKTHTLLFSIPLLDTLVFLYSFSSYSSHFFATNERCNQRKWH